MAIRCNICGKEYSYGRKISLDCCGEVSNFGVIFENGSNTYDWNCTTPETPNSERDLGETYDIQAPQRTTERNFALVCE